MRRQAVERAGRWEGHPRTGESASRSLNGRRPNLAVVLIGGLLLCVAFWAALFYAVVEVAVR